MIKARLTGSVTRAKVRRAKTVMSQEVCNSGSLSLLRSDMPHLYSELWTDDIRARMAARDSGISQARSRRQQRTPQVNLVPLQAQASGSGRPTDKTATFGQRRSSAPSGRGGRGTGAVDARHTGEGGMELTFVPRSSGAYESDEDMDGTGRSASKGGAGGKKDVRRKGVETFGAGVERGGQDPGRELSESDRQGRAHRREGMWSGSKNTFRRS